MGKVYACVGRYSANPYTIKKTGMRVYCVEELCYYIRNNAYFIDDDFFGPDLYSWLDEECNLKGLAKILRARSRQDGRIETLVRTLFEEVHYCSPEELAETKGLLKTNRSIPGKQKLKIRADYFLGNGKLSMAMQTYEDLLSRLDEKKDSRLAGSVYHNIGVIYARMFIYGEAASFFEKAYAVDGLKEHRVCYLAAQRMRMSDSSYLKFISGCDYPESEIVEAEIKNAMDELKASDEFIKLKGLKQLKSEGETKELENGIEREMENIKENYRALLE